MLRIVAVLALPIAVRPLSEKRRGASQFTIRGDDFVEFRAVQKVVVDGVGNFRGQVERVHEAIVHAAARTVIPKNAISVAREEHRYRDICIVLRKLDVLAAIIPDAGLVLPESVECLLRVPHICESLRAIGLFSIHLDRCQRPCIFLRQLAPGGIEKNHRPVFFHHCDLQL